MSRMPFRLKNTIGRTYSVDPDDVLNTKLALVDLGHMRIPDYGLTPYPDNRLFDGIRSYQRRNNLRDDSVMEPDGPTLHRLNRSLWRRHSPLQEPKREQTFPPSEKTSVIRPSGPSAPQSKRGIEPDNALTPKSQRESNLLDLLLQFADPLNDDSLRLSLSQRANNQAGLSDREKDLCDERFRREMQRCAQLPGKWHGPCAQRATIRWGLCYRYGYPPGPDKEPPEWGPGDMEESFNPRR